VLGDLGQIGVVGGGRFEKTLNRLYITPGRRTVQRLPQFMGIRK
jgi:hypothetical protein